jgi:hypothetical protein
LPRTCTICVHARLIQINNALLRSEAYRSIAKHFGVSESAVYRHQQHLPAAPPTPMKQKDVAEFAQADSLLAKIAQLETEARRLGKKAEDAGDLRGAMAAVRELVRIVEILGKLQGEITEAGGTTVNVVYVNPPSVGRSNRIGPVTGADEMAPSVSVDLKTQQ